MSNLPLHQIIEGMSDPEVQESELIWTVEQIQKAIEQGADIHATDEAGNTALDCLFGEQYQGTQEEQRLRREALGCLLAAGADYMTCRENWVHEWGWPVTEYVFERFHAGHGVHGPDGSNLLHVIAKLDPEFLAGILINHIINDSTNAVIREAVPTIPKNRQVPIEWLSEQRTTDGNTPLMIAWEGLASDPPDAPTSMKIWLATGLFLSKDPKALKLRNHQGVGVASMVSGAIQAGMFTPNELESLAGSILAQADLEQLEAQTPVIGASRKSGVRL